MLLMMIYNVFMINFAQTEFILCSFLPSMFVFVLSNSPLQVSDILSPIANLWSFVNLLMLINP